MTDLLVILSHGHAGRPDKPLDVGAVVDGYTERDLTPLYMRALESALRGHGVPCWTLSDGTLIDRQERAKDHGRRWLRDHPEGLVFYVPCHGDAAEGAPQRALWMHDYRSSMGRALAHDVAAAVKDAGIEGLERQVIVPARPDRSWPGPWAVQSRIYKGPARMCSLLAEPFVMPAHLPLLSPGWLSQIGAAMAQGILNAAERLSTRSAA